MEQSRVRSFRIYELQARILLEVHHAAITGQSSCNGSGAEIEDISNIEAAYRLTNRWELRSVLKASIYNVDVRSVSGQDMRLYDSAARQRVGQGRAAAWETRNVAIWLSCLWKALQQLSLLRRQKCSIGVTAVLPMCLICGEINGQQLWEHRYDGHSVYDGDHDRLLSGTRLSRKPSLHKNRAIRSPDLFSYQIQEEQGADHGRSQDNNRKQCSQAVAVEVPDPRDKLPDGCVISCGKEKESGSDQIRYNQPPSRLRDPQTNYAGKKANAQYFLGGTAQRSIE